MIQGQNYHHSFTTIIECYWLILLLTIAFKFSNYAGPGWTPWRSHDECRGASGPETRESDDVQRSPEADRCGWLCTHWQRGATWTTGYDGIRRVSIAAGSCQVSINDSSISFSPCYCAPEWARWAMNHWVSLTVSLSSESEGFRMTCLLDHFDVTLLYLISMSSWSSCFWPRWKKLPLTLTGNVCCIAVGMGSEGHFLSQVPHWRSREQDHCAATLGCCWTAQWRVFLLP